MEVRPKYAKPCPMNALEIQHLSKFLNPLFAVALVICAVRELKKSSLLWILCVAVALGIAQQISKVVQNTRVVSDNFPSTHFAVSLVIGGAFWALGRKFVPAAVVFLVVYAGLILWQHYHTPLDLAGALYALPMGFFAGRFGTRPRKVASN